MSGARRRARWGLASLLFLPPAIVPASEPPDIGLAQLGIERWGAEVGLAGSWVRDIVRGRDGFLWIATSGGLSRYDGRSFVNFNVANSPAQQTNSVTALALGSGNRIWIGLEHGGVLCLEKGRIERECTLAPIPKTATVRDLLEDSSGFLWVATTSGLWRVSADAAERVSPGADSRAAEVRSLAASDDGQVWAMTAVHGIWRSRSGAIEAVPGTPTCNGYGLALGPRGGVFASCAEGVFRWDAEQGRWSQLSSERGIGPVFLDRRGRLWFGSRSGLRRRSAGSEDTLPVREGLGDWRVRAIFEDDGGDLWIGTYSGGLARLRHGAIRAFGAPEGLPVEQTRAVLARPDGDLWIGGDQGGLVRWSPTSGVIRRWATREGLPGERVLALALDPRRPGGVWVRTDVGLAWVEDGAVRKSVSPGIAYEGGSAPLFVDPASADTIWAARYSGGALEILPGRRIVHDRSNGLDLAQIAFLRRDRSGRLLAGGDAGLFQLEKGRWSTVRFGSGTVRALTAILEEPDGTLWLASSISGLIRRSPDGSVSYYGAEHGLPFSRIHSLEQDRSGGVWLSGDEGLARFRLEDHRRWRRGEINAIPFEALRRRDGLRDAECNGWGSPASTQLPSGVLAYPTTTGVALVDATLLPSVELTPEEIFVDAAWAGARSLPLDGPLRLAEHERSLRVRFSAIEMTRPEAVVFRYRLEGFDDAWIPAGRAAEATYSRLTPGSLRFRLQARLPGQEWAEAARLLQVEVQPQVWETTWLQTTVVGLGLAIGYGAFRWRIRIQARHAAALARERAFLREVIDTSPNPVFARRPDGTYSLANRAVAGIYGLAPVDLEGRSPRELGRGLPGMEIVDALDAEVIGSAGERVLSAAPVVDHAGRRRWFRVVKRPGFGPDGRTVEQVLGTAVDVTDFKRAEVEARRLSLQLLRAQEDERRLLAREIHDDFTQRLAGLAMLAWGTLQGVLKDRAHDVRKSLEELGGELERVANDVQALSRELHPPGLESLGLAEALRAECATFSRRTGLAVAFKTCGDIVEPAPEVALALYRIAQEGLRNCLTHSGSRTASVKLAGHADGTVLEIEDAGVGFDAALARSSPGLGLSSMRERARLVGGALELDSAPGRGTRVSVRIRTRAEPEGDSSLGQR